MKQAQTILPTYTADVSGVCSALFELGGMTVMHDASGCNSTYHTHDEPRWYDTDSLVFISGLTELEAVMGDDEKLISDILQAADELHPRFIALAGTPIPMMTGCDIPAIAKQIEQRSGIPSFGFSTNGMHSYVMGASVALATYADRFVKPAERKIGGVNILGATPLDFSVNGSVEQMQRRLSADGFSVISTWAMHSEALEGASAAEVNLVVSSVGLETAKLLQRKFGTPYVVGTPYGEEFSQVVTTALRQSIRTGENGCVFSGYEPTETQAVIVGESVTSRSLAAALAQKYGIQARVLCPLEVPKGVLSSADLSTEDEEEIRRVLTDAAIVVADPLYRPLTSPNSRFCPLPHEACSGRLYRSQMTNLVERITIL